MKFREDERTSIGNISIIFKGDPEETIATSVSIFRRSLIVSFIILLILHKLGVFVTINRALGPATNATIAINGGSPTEPTSGAAVLTKVIAHYGDKTDTFPPEMNHFEVPPSRKGKCVVVVGLPSTGNTWIWYLAHELLLYSKAEDVSFGVNKVWFSRKGALYEATVELLNHENVVLLSNRFEDIILGQADVVINSYRDLRDYVVYLKHATQKAEKSAIDLLGKHWEHAVEWNTHLTISLRFEDIVNNKLEAARKIADSMGFQELKASELEKIVREVDEKMKESATYATDALSEENKQKTNYFIGSYKTQLESDTVRQLEETYGGWLANHEYPLSKQK
eukprot:TRINITY_DN3416_c0_g1_i2.p1 TRINITY_DN3416_c0_g1~~TRINITY_DN3416_c0_g1_i2.p1  ORF type:complete len:338 (+),score=72.05 TRINITY_DN3416_c0_g1_i2:226-1239(+)